MATTDEQTREAPGRLDDERAAPDGPTDLKAGSWRGVLSRTVREFKEDNLTVWAAALTYYGILAIFPAIIALVSILGLIGPSATQPLLDNVSQVAPGPAKDILTSTIQNLQNNRGSAGVMFFVGIALALWSASGYVAAFMQASNAIYDIAGGAPDLEDAARPPRRDRGARDAAGGQRGGRRAHRHACAAGRRRDRRGSTAVTVWDIAKWPVLLLIVSLMFAILYYASPNVKQPGFRWVSPGGLLAVVLWIVASAAFAFYVGELRLLQQDLRRARGRDSSSSGCGSRTSPCSSAPSSTPSSSAAGASRRGTRPTSSRSSSRATRGSSPTERSER